MPRQVEENYAYRLALQDHCSTNTESQRNVWEMCRQDTFFWINSFCWLYEPRPRPRTLPFVLWPHQEPALAKAERCLGHRDCGLEKSRSEGASWLLLMLFLKYWIFGDPLDDTIKMFSFGLVSKDEASVDDPDNPDTLMWKLDFQLKQLPYWMVPNFDRRVNKHILRNNDNGNTIVGYSATGDVASGGRKTAFLMDEMSKFPRNSDYAAMSSTQYVTDCRYVVSTFKGNYGYYYDAMRGPASSMEKIVLDWKDNPIRNIGMYQVTKGRVREQDREGNPLPSGYTGGMGEMFETLRKRGFSIESRLRSPWYDTQCLRTGATPSSIAEELDRDPERSGSPFFDINILERLIANTADPIVRGSLDYELDTYRPMSFEPSQDGNWKLWFPILPGGGPDRTLSYSMGIDIAAGGGGSMSSNSCISVANSKGEKVAEFTSPNVYPQKLAHLAHAAGNWFRGPSGPALLIYEANGTTGAQFGSSIKDSGYTNLFLGVREGSSTGRRTGEPGFVNQGKNRGSLYGGYRWALTIGQYYNPSRDALEECKFYQHASNDGIEHSSALQRGDPSGATHNHGDRATADALSLRGLKDINGPEWGAAGKTKARKEPDINTQDAPMGSFAHRRIEAMSSRERQDSVW